MNYTFELQLHDGGFFRGSAQEIIKRLMYHWRCENIHPDRSMIVLSINNRQLSYMTGREFLVRSAFQK